MLTTAERFRRIRRATPDAPATWALAYARHLNEVDELLNACELDYVESWTDSSTFHILTMTLPSGARVKIFADPDTYEWGDIAPTDDERENLSVIGAVLVYAGDDDDDIADSCWGYGFDGRTSHVEQEAASFIIGMDWPKQAETEAAERDRLAGFVETVEG